MTLKVIRNVSTIKVSAPGPQGPSGVSVGGGGAYAATSTTSLTVSNSGTKTLTVQANLSYSAGSRLRITSGSAWIEGICSSYSGTILVFVADKSSGSGTFNSWTVNIAGEPGATGPAGPTGPSGSSTPFFLIF
jgi:hypothetical protein